jgi:hypothetical protein
MRKHYIIKQVLLGFGSLLFTGFSMAQGLQTTAATQYIYVFCGKELPKNFDYVIEKRSLSDTSWQLVAQTCYPGNESGIKGMLLDAPPAISLNILNDETISRLQRISSHSQTLDSLRSFANNPMTAYAFGCAWWDTALSKQGSYEYRISKKSRQTGNLEMVKTETVRFPAKSAATTIAPLEMQLNEDNVVLSYSYPGSYRIAGIKLYRSLYRENDFKEIPATILFTTSNRQPILTAIDKTVTAKTAYSYYAVPYDVYGAEGDTSATISLYNVAKPQAVALVNTIEAVSNDKEQAVQLRWTMNNTSHLISVDIFRCDKKDGVFKKLASVSPADTLYNDHDVLPVTTYYYSLVANGFYGKSNPSARVAGMLKAHGENLFPPQHIRAVAHGNVVQLSWTQTETDTRAYYLYRCSGFHGALIKSRSIILSRDSLVSVMDTLPVSTSSVYSYAVADENTSYAISPLSERVSVSVATNMLLATPQQLQTRYTGKAVELFWKTANTNSILGYDLYRTATNESGLVGKFEKINGAIIPAISNSYTDRSVTDGWHYLYTVRAIGFDTTQTSSFSPAASITLAANLPATPQQVTALQTEKGILLQWNKIIDPSLKKIKLYRAEKNKSPQLLAETEAGTQEYTDSTISPGTTYFYLLSSVNNQDKESRLSEAIGIRSK